MLNERYNTCIIYVYIIYICICIYMTNSLLTAGGALSYTNK